MTWTPKQRIAARDRARYAVELRDRAVVVMDHQLDELALGVAHLPAPLSMAHCKRLDILGRELRRLSTYPTGGERDRESR